MKIKTEQQLRQLIKESVDKHLREAPVALQPTDPVEDWSDMIEVFETVIGGVIEDEARVLADQFLEMYGDSGSYPVRIEDARDMGPELAKRIDVQESIAKVVSIALRKAFR